MATPKEVTYAHGEITGLGTFSEHQSKRVLDALLLLFDEAYDTGYDAGQEREQERQADRDRQACEESHDDAIPCGACEGKGRVPGMVMLNERHGAGYGEVRCLTCAGSGLA